MILTASAQIRRRRCGLLQGLLAGMMLAVALEQNAAQELGGDAWTARQNMDDKLFRKVMPFVFLAILASSGSGARLLAQRART